MKVFENTRKKKVAMEAALRKSVHGDFVKEEMKNDSNGDEEGCKGENLHKEPTMCKTETSADANSLKASPSSRKEQDDPLESAKAEMHEMIQENQRLRMYLNQMMKDYQKLQMQYQDIVQQEEKKTKHENEEPEFFSLTLGRTSSDNKKEENGKNFSAKQKVNNKEGFDLGLECKFEMPSKEPIESSTNLSHENSVEEVKEEGGEIGSPRKLMKTTRSGEEEDTSQQNPTKKARVSVRVRCDTPTMNDGCQWRKYGQKIAKGNPCPRAYYRCTIAPNCPVRKQVQRCAEDMSILTTTYEGTHNHPLPVAATAFASTTSAAASMLLSGSSSSSTTGTAPDQSVNATFPSTNFNSLNFHNLSSNSTSKPFYFPNSSISSSSSHPTITLDLTSSSSSSLNPITRLNSFPQRYSTTNLSFSSFESNKLPTSWTNRAVNPVQESSRVTLGSNQFSSSDYVTTSYNKNQNNSLSFGKQPQDHNHWQYYLQKDNLNCTQTHLPPETIAAATKAIASDPSFQSALVTALSSIICSTNGNADNKSNQSLKLSEPFPVISSFPTTSSSNNFVSSENSQPFSLQPSLSFSTSKSKSSSPGEHGYH